MAIGISAISVLYNGAEGGISIGFGNKSHSYSLIFFGIQSMIEVISASLVLWRFSKIAKPGEEVNKEISPEMLQIERIATISIGILLSILAICTWIVSITALVKREHPNEPLPGIIISCCALLIMIFIWAPKPWLAKKLNSSAMYGEAKCSLACIGMTCVLLVGTVITMFWEGGWWVDSLTAIALGLLFARDALHMIRWGLSKKFSGGCCSTCSPSKNGRRNEGTFVECDEHIECCGVSWDGCGSKEKSCCSPTFSKPKEDCRYTCCTSHIASQKDDECQINCCGCDRKVDIDLESCCSSAISGRNYKEGKSPQSVCCDKDKFCCSSSKVTALEEALPVQDCCQSKRDDVEKIRDMQRKNEAVAES